MEVGDRYLTTDTISSKLAYFVKGDGSSGDIVALQGPSGARCLKGDSAGKGGVEGPDGPPGKIGKMGPVGSRGGIGVRGEKGDKGDTGGVGQQGPIGPQGRTDPRGSMC